MMQSLFFMAEFCKKCPISAMAIECCYFDNHDRCVITV